MAFTTTVLSWSVVGHMKDAVRCATDYFLKAYTATTELYVQVGNPNVAHTFWERPEDMDTPRTLYKIDADHPGSDVAGETAAALAAASMAFQISDPPYAEKLLAAAKGIFSFVDKYRGKYSDVLGDAVTPFYNSYW